MGSTWIAIVAVGVLALVCCGVGVVLFRDLWRRDSKEPKEEIPFEPKLPTPASFPTHEEMLAQQHGLSAAAREEQAQRERRVSCHDARCKGMKKHPCHDLSCKNHKVGRPR